MQRTRKWLGIGTGIVLAAVLASAGFAQALWSDEPADVNSSTSGGEVTENIPVYTTASSARTFNGYKADGVSGPDTVVVPANATSVDFTVTLPPGEANTQTWATLTETNT